RPPRLFWCAKRAAVSDVMAARLVRGELLQTAPVVHGSVSAQELAYYGRTPSDVLDLSVNTNPLGPAPSVLRAVREVDWHRYPGDDDAPLRSKLAQRAGLTTEQLALGNGSAELMWLIALAALRDGDQAAVVVPTFGEYARAAHAAGASVLEVRRPSDAGRARLL